jgi:uncharacterized protein YjiS (DUF1127 family)
VYRCSAALTYTQEYDMIEKLKAWVANIVLKIIEGRQRQVDYYLLTTLSDYQLKDMGLTRGELKQRVLYGY